MTKSQTSSGDVVQRRMLRNIIGWVRNDDEPWDETMRRMNSKIEAALRRYPIEDWSTQLFRRQFRLAHRAGKMVDSWPARVCKWHPPTSIPGATRSQGRPFVRWDDYLRRFAENELESAWYAACLNDDFPQHEDAFVRFSLNIQSDD